MKCHQCGFATSSEDNFCAKCGVQLRRAAQRAEGPCRNCHAQVPEASKFCGHCGVVDPTRQAQVTVSDAGPSAVRKHDLIPPCSGPRLEPLEPLDWDVSSALGVPSGWPDITEEIAEARFLLLQGIDADAREAIASLHAKYPGHPDLAQLDAPHGFVAVDLSAATHMPVSNHDVEELEPGDETLVDIQTKRLDRTLLARAPTDCSNERTFVGREYDVAPAPTDAAMAPIRSFVPGAGPRHITAAAPVPQMADGDGSGPLAGSGATLPGDADTDYRRSSTLPEVPASGESTVASMSIADAEQFAVDYTLPGVGASDESGQGRAPSLDETDGDGGERPANVGFRLIILDVAGEAIAEQVIPPGAGLDIGGDIEGPWHNELSMAGIHVRLVPVVTGVRVADVARTGGVFVRISAPTMLTHGDQIRVGQSILLYERFEADVDECPFGRLSVVDPGGTWRRGAVVSDNGVVVGREAGDIVLRGDTFASSAHCRIRAVADGGTIVEDLDSSNGTYLRVRDGAELGEGSNFLVGQTQFLLQAL